MVYRFIKRAGDLFAAIVLLTLGLPFLAGIILLILLIDGAPVFFRQKRAGFQGNVVNVLKLRTLKVDNDPLKPSEHLTRLGGFLRRFGIDELPQVYNILKNEMSFVGPRPILLTEAENYNSVQRRRLDVLPGITGWAQVNGRNNLGWQERVDLDLWYVDHASLGLDIKILFLTPFAVADGKSVYGPGNLDPTAADFSSANDTVSGKK